MKKTPEQIDKFLEEILKEGALEAPESKLYTPSTMAAIYAFEDKKEKRRQFIYGLLGVTVGIIVMIGLFLLWQSGLLNQFLFTLKNIFGGLSSSIPFQLTPVFLLVLVLHHVFNSGFIIVYFLKKKAR